MKAIALVVTPMLAFFVGWTQVARLSESNFQAAVAACKCGNECAKNLSATDTSKGPSNSVAGSAQVGLLHARSGGIASDGASDELDNQIDNGA